MSINDTLPEEEKNEGNQSSPQPDATSATSDTNTHESTSSDTPGLSQNDSENNIVKNSQEDAVTSNDDEADTPVDDSNESPDQAAKMPEEATESTGNEAAIISDEAIVGEEQNAQEVDAEGEDKPEQGDTIAEGLASAPLTSIAKDQSPEREESQSAIESRGEEHIEEETAEEVDYHPFNKQQLVDELQKLIDSKRPIGEATLRKIKDAFDAIFDAERDSAKEAFINDGGEEADFQFKEEGLNKTFRERLKALRDRRRHILEELENTRQINLKLKQQQLELLKKAIEEEDESNKSFDEVKRIQQVWRSIGPVPQADANDLYSLYRFYLEKFYNRQSMVNELKELDKKKNLEVKTTLLERANALLNEERIVNALQEYHHIFDEFRHTGPAPREDNDRLWNEIRSIYQKLNEKKKVIDEGSKKEAEEIAAKRQLLVDKMKELSGFESEVLQDWQKKSEEIAELQKAWNETGGKFRSRHAELSKQFWGGLKKFYSAKDQVFKKADRERQQNLKQKQDLLKEMQELVASPEKGKQGERFKELLANWKAVGPIPFKQRDALNKSFSAALDEYYQERNQVRSKTDNEQKENLTSKEEICTKLEALGESKAATAEEVMNLYNEFDSIGHVPYKLMEGLRTRFKAAVNKAIDSSDILSASDKNQLKLQLLRSQPGSRGPQGGRGERREGPRSGPNRGGDGRRDFNDRRPSGPNNALQFKIKSLESDVNTYRTNLDFFASSKTASKIKEEYEAKIARAEEEIKLLKDQLNILKTEGGEK